MLVYFTISRINLEAIEYFLDNYKLSDKLKSEIKVVLENKIDKLLIENTLKREHIVNRTIFQYLYDSSFDKDNYVYGGNIFSYYKGIIETALFYSLEETEVISDKLRYDLINNKGEKYDFKCSVNLKNYIGRILMCNNGSNYMKQYQKEQDLIDLRQVILDKLF